MSDWQMVLFDSYLMGMMSIISRFLYAVTYTQVYSNLWHRWLVTYLWCWRVAAGAAPAPAPVGWPAAPPRRFWRCWAATESRSGVGSAVGASQPPRPAAAAGPASGGHVGRGGGGGGTGWNSIRCCCWGLGRGNGGLKSTKRGVAPKKVGNHGCTALSAHTHVRDKDKP